MNLPDNVKEKVIELAQKYRIKKVILFGSRARGDNWERSDIDLAISGGDRVRFALDIDEIEIVSTLLMFDVVDLDEPCNEDLLESIQRDGIVLYEEE